VLLVSNKIYQIHYYKECLASNLAPVNLNSNIYLNKLLFLNIKDFEFLKFRHGETKGICLQGGSYSAHLS
jgi:hypothetical protein